jgi:hypothetical protein
MPIKKRRPFRQIIYFMTLLWQRGGGNCRLSCRKIVAPHLLKLNNTLHPSRRHNRAILNICILHRQVQFFCYHHCHIHWNCIHSKLKGSLTRDFRLHAFFMTSFPQAPEYPVEAIPNVYENSRRYSKVKVGHRCQQHRR